MLERTLTPAEQVLIQQGTRQTGKRPFSLSRTRALNAFTAMGLPSRKVENWHYTDLAVLLRDVPEDRMPPKAGLHPSLLNDILTIGLVNGQAQIDNLLEFITPLHKQFTAGDEAALPLWRGDDVIAQINTVHVSDGFRIDLTTDQIVEIQNIVEAGQAHIHLPIHVAAKTKATIILREIGGEASSFSTTVSSLEMGEEAEVVFIIVRQRGEAASELSQFKAKLQQGAKLNLFIVNAGGKLVRQEIHVDVNGGEADFQLRGINLLNGRSHTDVTMDVRHLSEGSSSTEILRNVVMDRARGVFQGMIRVAQQAQKTDARMACNSLILSDDAEFSAKPELEIFADNVVCGHGATVAQINPDHLFYLMARGIPEAQARGLLIKAFVNELAEEIENEALQDAVKNVIDRWLEINS